jgi:uncharacterized protein YbaA (DUF1428 family)
MNTRLAAQIHKVLRTIDASGDPIPGGDVDSFSAALRALEEEYPFLVKMEGKGVLRGKDLFQAIQSVLPEEYELKLGERTAVFRKKDSKTYEFKALISANGSYTTPYKTEPCPVLKKIVSRFDLAFTVKMERS